MHTSWNLSLLYSSHDDPAIEKDVKKIESLCASFEKKYKATISTVTTTQKLLPIFVEYHKLQEVLSVSNPVYYFSLMREVASNDEKAEAMETLLSQRITKAYNKVMFFSLYLASVPPAFQARILADARFAPYNYLLKSTFENAVYNLTEPEEKILSLTSLPAKSLWVSGFEKLLNKQTITYKKVTYPISEAIAKATYLPQQADRLAMSKKILSTLASISDFAESEINAIYNYKKINDELRGFKKPYSSMVVSNQNSEKEVEALVHAVSESNDIAHSYYKLKKRILKLDQFHYVDRNISIGNTRKKIPFTEAVATAKEIFASINPEYATILERYLSNGQIDVFPKKNKSGGAFCSSTHGKPVFVLLNHKDTVNDFFTLMHEMGHAIHAERSRTQPSHYEDYSIAVAEVASTLFESLAFDYLFEKASTREQVIMLHDKIHNDISTIHRQIAFFRFEQELHEKVREHGFVQNKEIATLFTTHLSSYMGKDVLVDPENGYGYLYISHIRRFFYVYTYAYGILIAKAIASRYKKNPAYAKDIDNFLSLGESMSPEDIFKSIGIATKDGSVFTDGLQSIRDDVAKLAILAKKEGML